MFYLWRDTINFFETSLLGILQGLTEFLPVSSSAHLAILQHLFHINDPNLLFILTLHIGTVIAVCLVFYKEIIRILCSYRACLLIIAASIPTAIIGFILEEKIEKDFISMQSVGIELILNGFILFLTKFKKPRVLSSEKVIFSDITGFKAFLIGIAQGIAIFPGISRSGSTIALALFLNIDRSNAGTFSFIISIPAIVGAFLLKIYKTPEFSISQFSPFLSGFTFSLIIGILSLIFLMKVIKKGEFHRFSYYCFLIGIYALFLK